MPLIFFWTGALWLITELVKVSSWIQINSLQFYNLLFIEYLNLFICMHMYIIYKVLSFHTIDEDGSCFQMNHWILCFWWWWYVKLETSQCRYLYQFSGVWIETNNSSVLVVVESKLLLNIVKNKKVESSSTASEPSVKQNYCELTSVTHNWKIPDAFTCFSSVKWLPSEENCHSNITSEI